MKIRKASLNDMESVRKLNQELFFHDFKFDKTLYTSWPSDNQEYFENHIKNNNSLVIIAEIENQIVGYLIASIDKAESWRNIKNIAELENMLIVKEQRDKGIGKKLIRQFILWAKNKKIKRAKVVASADNKKAIAVYKNSEFVEYNLVLERNL